MKIVPYICVCISRAQYLNISTSDIYFKTETVKKSFRDTKSFLLCRKKKLFSYKSISKRDEIDGLEERGINCYIHIFSSRVHSNSSTSCRNFYSWFVKRSLQPIENFRERLRLRDY